MDYLELTVKIEPKEPWAEVLMVELAEGGYESFVETENGLQAYAQLNDIDPNSPIQNTILENTHPDFKVEWEVKIIPQQNWNSLWEADFQKVEVEDYLTIHAPFHDKEGMNGMLIEILPKMSFGTGHHQTTWMMSKALFEMKGLPDEVLDMGTGTGVLAIIAEKLGAQKIVAVDIEDWSIENTIENAERNDCSKIEAICGDIEVLEGRKFGLILANINKNVLKRHLPEYATMLSSNNTLMLSGFFDTDIDEIVTYANQFGLIWVRTINKENWAAIELKKQ